MSPFTFLAALVFLQLPFQHRLVVQNVFRQPV
jgi:hypothetical protein